ncbi:MAG: PIN domain-containing protein [Chloroflexota bacterium]|nr:PIN domain-containing protein [Chloroflexota bacterium]
MLYVVDTNIISEWVKGVNLQVEQKIAALIAQNHTVALCAPVYYEAIRGMRWKGATVQIRMLETQIRPRLSWIDLTNDDWDRAATFWADTRRAGRQLSDIDLLLAALVNRLGATLISQDADFDALSIRRSDPQTL